MSLWISIGFFLSSQNFVLHFNPHCFFVFSIQFVDIAKYFISLIWISVNRKRNRMTFDLMSSCRYFISITILYYELVNIYKKKSMFWRWYLVLKLKRKYDLRSIDWFINVYLFSIQFILWDCELWMNEIRLCFYFMFFSSRWQLGIYDDN